MKVEAAPRLFSLARPRAKLDKNKNVFSLFILLSNFLKYYLARGINL